MLLWLGGIHIIVKRFEYGVDRRKALYNVIFTLLDLSRINLRKPEFITHTVLDKKNENHFLVTRGKSVGTKSVIFVYND